MIERSDERKGRGIGPLAAWIGVQCDRDFLANSFLKLGRIDPSDLPNEPNVVDPRTGIILDQPGISSAFVEDVVAESSRFWAGFPDFE